MSETAELFERVAKLQQDIEDLKEGQDDTFFNEREIYENRTHNCLKKSNNSVKLFFLIDGIRSISEIESDLKKEGKTIPHKTLWATSKQLLKCGLIKKVGEKRGSPIYIKKRWVKVLHIDDYVKSVFFKQLE